MFYLILYLVGLIYSQGSASVLLNRESVNECRKQDEQIYWHLPDTWDIKTAILLRGNISQGLDRLEQCGF